MPFRSVFIAVVIAFALILGAFLMNRARPRAETERPTAALVQATGKCAECHLRTQYAVVHQYEKSVHALVLILQAGVGIWGFVLHTMGNLQGPSIHAFDNFIYGAPPMAPLLFPNLMVLGFIGLGQLRKKESQTSLLGAA